MATESTIPGLLSRDLFQVLSIYFSVPVNVVIALFGMSTNTINIVIFSKMMPKDTMTMSLTALAVSDLLFSCFNLAYYVLSGLVFNGYPVLFRLDLESLLITGFAYQRPLFHKISAMITTFVSCERALCVIKPFLVKMIFTKRRVIISLASIYVGLIIFFVPVFVSGRLEWQYPINSTEAILMVHFNSHRYTAETVVILGPALSLIFATQLVIMIMAALMNMGLKKHQRFRQATASIPTTSRKPEHSDERAITSQGGATTIKSTKSVVSQTDTEKNQPSSSKEDRLIKTVFILAVMHVSLNTPLFIFYIAYTIEPELRALRRYHNTYMAVLDFTCVLQSLNGVFNVFVYLRMNSKYKSVFNEVFRPHTGPQSQ